MSFEIYIYRCRIHGLFEEMGKDAECPTCLKENRCPDCKSTNTYFVEEMQPDIQIYYHWSCQDCGRQFNGYLPKEEGRA